jgi:hypothetical protein
MKLLLDAQQRPEDFVHLPAQVLVLETAYVEGVARRRAAIGEPSAILGASFRRGRGHAKSPSKNHASAGLGTFVGVTGYGRAKKRETASSQCKTLVFSCRNLRPAAVPRFEWRRRFDSAPDTMTPTQTLWQMRGYLGRHVACTLISQGPGYLLRVERGGEVMIAEPHASMTTAVERSAALCALLVEQGWTLTYQPA